jgi:hypothetical protein
LWLASSARGSLAQPVGSRIMYAVFPSATWWVAGGIGVLCFTWTCLSMLPAGLSRFGAHDLDVGRFRQAIICRRLQSIAYLLTDSLLGCDLCDLAQLLLGLQIVKEDDNKWPEPDRVGKQELEVILNGQHISFTCTKLGSVMQVHDGRTDGSKGKMGS